MINILKFFQATIETPQAYGPFHLICLVIVIFSAAYLCVFQRNIKEKKLSKIIMILWSILVILEIYKQIVFSYSIVDGLVVWDYQWYVFPYQFCATPLTFLPLIALNKGATRVTKFIKESCIIFCSSYSLFAGLAVLMIPGDVFTNWLGIDLHTMFHHGTQVVVGVFLFAYYHRKINYSDFLKATPLFIYFLLTAMVLNEIFVHIADGTFNMFFISRHFPCTLPILNNIYLNIPYPAFLLTYFLSFTLCAFVVFNIVYWLTLAASLKRPARVNKFDHTISILKE